MDTYPGLRGAEGSGERKEEVRLASATGNAARDEMQQMTSDTSYRLQPSNRHQQGSNTKWMENFTQGQRSRASRVFSSASKMHKLTSPGMSRKLSKRLSFPGLSQAEKACFKL